MENISTHVRQMSDSVAGSFYPSDPAHLKRTIDTFMREADEHKIDGKLRALILPHAGYTYSGPVASKGYRLIRNLDMDKTWRVIIIGLSHFRPFSGISIGVYDKYATPLGPIPVSSLARDLLVSSGSFIPEAHENEHSIEVQLPFLKVALKHVEIVPILTSNTKPKMLADLLEPHMDDSTLLIASTDLSHMQPDNRARELDASTLNWIIDGDEKLLKKRGQACGMTGILTMLILSKRLGWKREQVGYATSADTHGDKTRVVGYGCVACYE